MRTGFSLEKVCAPRSSALVVTCIFEVTPKHSFDEKKLYELRKLKIVNELIRPRMTCINKKLIMR